MNRSPQHEPREFGWTLSQRRALLLLITVLLVCLTVQFLRNRAYVSDPQPSAGARSAELASRIDPNSADWQTLAAIPTLGEKRARAIVAYRDGIRAAAAGRVVYRTASDLLQVRGIGAATVENLRSYLDFPADVPDTQP
jgi:DNA uptake protein ComE-like DNA-binding protein